ncbi:DUF1192 domain-containing protein [Roseibium sp.]|uniref:DUF1192 domain-containing protein n=1 Tax=Roseibium sp. TaxID=1936156 RepID=UPI00326651DF
MGLFDDDVPRKPGTGAISVGEDLSQLSEVDLRDRIEALTGEIKRTQGELEQRGTIRHAANAIFDK